MPGRNSVKSAREEDQAGSEARGEARKRAIPDALLTVERRRRRSRPVA